MTATYTNLADATAAYLASANYDVDGSAALARQHIIAGRSLLVLLPQSASQGGATTVFRPDLIVASIHAAEAYLAAAGGAGAVRHLSVSEGEA